ncbi:LysR family transcriptional regulator [Undibacterium sp. TS12]|uniref:LysR family transcriptional regulator n=1 Tax=Undibacterium sp. TS12 TaxID=2908202 RepID=UPI001F4C6143|nr:LysR family transcriptional regulator [Undibacterium sp. TS12]MCH8620060.1 LysR family transcriptional regulator [Undibacterium sp. TS12]
MHQLDFNLLLDLDALLSEGSVAGAARRLHLSAPAMSRRLGRLRDAIGDPLFVPAGRGLVPTERALALRERVQTAILEVRGVFTPEEVNFATLERTLSLRTNDGFAGVWATRLAANIAAEAPGVSLHFIARTNKDLAPLRDGPVDLDIGVLGLTELEIYDQPLFKTSFVGVVRENHPLLETIRDGQVSAQDFVAWSQVSASKRGMVSMHGYIDMALKEMGLRRRITVVAPGFQAAMVMAAASDLVATIPEAFAQWALKQHRLQIFRLPVKTPEITISQSWHLRHHLDPVHRWLRAHVRALCAAESAAASSVNDDNSEDKP